MPNQKISNRIQCLATPHEQKPRGIDQNPDTKKNLFEAPCVNFLPPVKNFSFKKLALFEIYNILIHNQIKGLAPLVERGHQSVGTIFAYLTTSRGDY